MAVTPEECVKLRQPDLAQVSQLEKALDAHIKSAVRSNSRPYPMYVSTSFFGKDVLVKDELLRRYRAAGWDVVFQSDQRDGDFYKLSPTREIDEDEWHSNPR